VVRSRPDHRWLGISPAPWLKAFLVANEPGFPPSQAAPSISLAGGTELSYRQTTPGFPPKPNGPKFSLRRVAQSFLRVTQLGVAPPPRTLKFSLCRVVPGFPRGQRPWCPPNTAGAGLPRNTRPGACPLPGGLGYPPHRWHQAFPGTRGPKVRLIPVAQSFLFAGGAGLPLARRP